MSNNQEIQEVIEARLAAFVDNEIDAEDRVEIEKHLEQNPQHRRLLEELRKQRDLLRGLPHEIAPAEAGDGLASQIERSVLLEGVGRTVEPQMRIGTWSRPLAAAAIVLLTFGLAAIVYFTLPGRTAPTVAINQPAVKPPREANKLEIVENNPTDTEDADQKSAKPDAIHPAEPAPDHKLAAGPNVGGLSAGGGAPFANPKDGAEKEHGYAKGAAPAGIDPSARKREAEVEMLASNLSRDPQLKSLLARADGAVHPTMTTRPSDNAMVLVVRSANIEQVQQELADYLRVNKIDSQPAPQLQMALNAEQLGQWPATFGEHPVAAKGQANREPIAAGAPAAPLAQAAKKPGSDVLRKADGTPESPPAAPAHSAAPAASPSPAPAPAPTAAATPTPYPPALAAPIAPATRAPAASAVPEASDHPAVLADKSPRSLQSNAAADRAGVINALYVARGLSRHQRQELSEFLARNGEVREANVYPRSPNTAVAVLAEKSEAAKALAPGQSGQAEMQRRGNRNAGLLPATAPGSVDKSKGVLNEDTLDMPARRDDQIVQKGDKLRVSYRAEKAAAEQSETVQVNDNGTIAPHGTPAQTQPVMVAGKTLGEVQKVLQNAVTAVPSDSRGAVKAEVRVERVAAVPRGMVGGAVGPPFGSATQPSEQLKDVAADARALGRQQPMAPALPGPAADDALVDVVIVVQKEPTVPPMPTTLPTTVPAGH